MFVGYSKGGKKTAYAGIHQCQNCNNISQFHLVEYSFKPTLMFVPVAKFDLKYYFICSICERGYELDKANYDQMYRQSFELPKEETVIPYYNLLDDALIANDASLYNEIIDLLNNGEDLDSQKIYNKVISVVPSSLPKKHTKYIIKQKIIHTITAIQGEQ